MQVGPQEGGEGQERLSSWPTLESMLMVPALARERSVTWTTQVSALILSVKCID